MISHPFQLRKSSTLLLLSLIVLSVSCAAAQSTAPDLQSAIRNPKSTILDREAPFRRVLWVTRWDFRSPEDIEKIFYNAASARFTDVLFQVRGEGTVFFKSRIEPWAWELSGKGPGEGVGHDPGWDPLAKAVEEGRRRGLRVHAYLNVLPGWAQKVVPPKSSGQLYAAHRDWFMVDRRGRRMTTAKGYAFVDPGLPQVRAHLARLFGEVAARYAVDGIHLDYIRYPFDYAECSYHPAVLETFKTASGGTPQQFPKRWDAFRREQITKTVREISGAVRRARPGVEISVAVIADRARSRDKAFQAPFAWLREGLVDAIAPMAYINEMAAFEALCRTYLTPEWRAHVWPGVIANPEKNTHLGPQIRRAVDLGFGTVAVFAYSNLFTDHRSTKRAVEVYQAFTEE